MGRTTPRFASYNPQRTAEAGQQDAAAQQRRAVPKPQAPAAEQYTTCLAVLLRIIFIAAAAWCLSLLASWPVPFSLLVATILAFAALPLVGAYALSVESFGDAGLGGDITASLVAITPASSLAWSPRCTSAALDSVDATKELTTTSTKTTGLAASIIDWASANPGAAIICGVVIGILLCAMLMAIFKRTVRQGLWSFWCNIFGLSCCGITKDETPSVSLREVRAELTRKRGRVKLLLYQN